MFFNLNSSARYIAFRIGHLLNCLILLLFLTLFKNLTVSAQSVHSGGGISISAFYCSEFALDGYVQVREWELEGDKMNLEELGMKHYPAIQLLLEKQFRKRNSLSFSFEQYFMQGKASLNRTIAYNGTKIECVSGIDVSPSRYFRLSGYYKRNLYSRKSWQLQYIAGLVFDHINFCIDGVVAPDSPRNEVCENFGKQALPYPVLGISTRYDFNDANSLNFEISGTYIPLFESFYVEGSNMYLQYSTLLTDLSYVRSVASWELTLGTKFRSMHLFQESQEDTNDLKIEVISPYLGIGFVFK